MNEPVVRGVGIESAENEYVALINCSDLVDWLKNPGHNLDPAERELVDDLANLIYMIGRDILHRDLGV